MAQFLRSKLHALCSSRLSPPALVPTLLRSPDLRLSSQRWLAEDALLEDHGISVMETDGESNAANEDELLAKPLKGRQSNKLFASNNPSSKVADNVLESSLGRLTSLVSAKHEAHPSILHGKEGNKDQTQTDRPSAEEIGKSSNDDWEKMVSGIPSLSIKKKLKGIQTNGNNIIGSLNGEQIKRQYDTSDLHISQSRRQSSTEHLAATGSGLQNARLQNSNQQKMKDTRGHDLSDVIFENEGKPAHDLFFQVGDDIRVKNRQPNKEDSLNLIEERSGLFNASKSESNFQIRNQTRNKDMLPSITKGQEYNSRGASEGSNLQDIDHISTMSNTQDKGFSQPPKALDNPLNQDASHQALNNNNGACKQLFMVCVQNLPPSSNPSTVKASMAVHGEVVGFFKKTTQNRLNIYVQFKTAVAMEKALASRRLLIGFKKCHIVRADNPAFTTVVRVSKVANDIDLNGIWTVCKRYGKVDDVKKRAPGVFDVIYDAKELSNISSILGSLCDVTIDRSTWLALPAPLLHPSVQKELVKSPEGQAWLDIQLTQAMFRTEAGLDALSVVFQDLKELNTVAREYCK